MSMLIRRCNMKKIIASLLLMSSAISMNAAVNVNRIEPTDRL
jgi:neopullulanase